MFQYLDQFERQVRIVETGCVRGTDGELPGEKWAGDGCSTILFDRYVTLRTFGGAVTSIDIDNASTNACRALVSDRTTVTQSDSVRWLSWLAADGAVADLIYLDSLDFDTVRPLASEVHHVNELMAALPMIGDHTLVVVDDSPVQMDQWGRVQVAGKGALVARYAVEVGAKLRFSKYQIGWTCMVGGTALNNVSSDDELKAIVERGRKYAEAGDDLSAIGIYEFILRLTVEPKTRVQNVAHAEACLFFARAAITYGRMGTASDWYHKALHFDPKAVDYRLELATRVLRPMKALQEAKHQALLATRIEPRNKWAWRILGGFHHDLSEMDEAKHCYERELEIDPDDPDSILDMVSILLDEPDYDRASKLARKVVDETDQKGEGYHCLAFIAYRQGRHEEAVTLYDEALKVGVSQEATVHWNRSLALHALGRYREGWEDHEWRDRERTQMALYMPLLRFNRPRWRGEPPPASIHVHAEAGAGDNLCCARYLNILVDQGYDVRYECYADMVPLIARSFPSVKVQPQALDYPGAIGISPFDYHAPIGILPHVLGTEVDTVPWSGPYLIPDYVAVEKYRGMLASLMVRRKVGLCWSAGIREGLWITKYGRRKSMHFDDLKPLWKLTGDLHRICFVSLQVGPERSQNTGWVDEVLPDRPTWDDTAALVANLDLVITVDTSVAHLAGAMGKETWLMNTAEPGSWHWMAERPGSPWNERSPWYPSVKIYRQQKVGEWRDVVEKIAAGLKGL